MRARFENVLRSVGRRLELPHPARTRILQELSSDLEDLYRAYRDRGLDEQVAARRAERLLEPSPGSLEDLSLVHAPLYRRWLARLSARTRHRAERVLLTGIAATVLAGGLVGLAHVRALTDPSPFLWPVLAIGAAVAALGTRKLFLLYVKRDHTPERLRSGLGALLALGVASPVVAVIGFVIDTYRMAHGVAASIDRQYMLVMDWIRQDAVLLIVALLVALAAGLAWFLCLRRVIAVEWAEAAIYAGPSGSRTRHST